MRRHLLFDGDVLVYRFAHGEQETTQWNKDLFTVHARLGPAKVKLDGFIAEHLLLLEAASYTVVLSDLEDNFRFRVLPGYKENRKDVKRPLLFKSLREHLVDEHAALTWPSLEGDDVLGILLTRPPKTEELEVICLTIDKDLRTVPGHHYNFDKGGGIVWVGQHAADWAWMMQTLTGDRVDGYPGCPKIGPVRARRILEARHALTTDRTREEWVRRYAWPSVVRAYQRAGLDEAAALANARCARILRHGEYNVETGEVSLWTPPAEEER